MAGYKHLEIPGNFERFVKDKKQSANAYYRYLLARLTRMFEYKNLPDTIPHHILDRYLFNNGIALITKVNDKLYCFYGNAGGPQDVYYRPCQFIVANPHIVGDDGIEFSANITVFENDRYPELGEPTGVLMRNDTEWFGLAPLLSRYSYLMAENTLTLRTADVLLRITSLLTAPSDKERAAALEYLKAMENGNLGVIGESAFFDGIKLQSPPSNNGSYLTQFIEYQQYLKGSFYNEIGLSANYNMKREAIGKGESTLDEDALLPLCDDMLLCRKQDLERVNNMFGTEIEVSFSSAWLENMIETKSTLVEMSGSTQQPSVPFGAESPIGGGVTQQNDADGEVPQNDTDDADGDNDNDVLETQTGYVGAEGADGAEESPDEPETNDEEVSEEAEASEENSESEINDISWSDDLHEILDDIGEEKDQPIGLTQKGDEDDDGRISGQSDEETADNQGNVSED